MSYTTSPAKWRIAKVDEDPPGGKKLGGHKRMRVGGHNVHTPFVSMEPCS